MKRTHILAFAATALWAIALRIGFNGIDLARSQHIAGWPSAGNIRYFIYAPAILFSLTVSAWALAARWQRLRVSAVIFFLLAILALPVYLLGFTGGV